MIIYFKCSDNFDYMVSVYNNNTVYVFIRKYLFNQSCFIKRYAHCLNIFHNFWNYLHNDGSAYLKSLLFKTTDYYITINEK